MVAQVGITSRITPMEESAHANISNMETQIRNAFVLISTFFNMKSLWCGVNLVQLRPLRSHQNRILECHGAAQPQKTEKKNAAGRGPRKTCKKTQQVDPWTLEIYDFTKNVSGP